MMNELAERRRLLDRQLQNLSHARRRVKDEKRQLAEAEETLADLTEAQAVAQAVAEAVQQTAHTQIAGVVTRCLQVVGFPYEFNIEFERKRGRTEAVLGFEDKGRPVSPRGSAEGGAVDVAALALRLSCLKLGMPRKRQVIVADEPFRYINGEVYQERAAALLEALTEKGDLQLLIVSDDNWIREIGHLIEV